MKMTKIEGIDVDVSNGIKTTCKGHKEDDVIIIDSIVQEKMTETFEEQFPSLNTHPLSEVKRWIIEAEAKIFEECTRHKMVVAALIPEPDIVFFRKLDVQKHCLDKQLIFKLNPQDLEQCSLMLGLDEKGLINQIKTNPIACAVFNIHLQYLKKVKETIYLSLNQGKTTEELGLEEE